MERSFSSEDPNLLEFMNKKLPAFTLIELLFALALSGLVLIMGSASFRVFTSFFNRYDQQVKNTYEAMIFKDRLSKDFDQASYMDLIARSPAKKELILYALNKEILYSYAFQDSLILRRSFLAAEDSFALKTAVFLHGSGQSLQVREKELDLEYVFALKAQARVNRNELQPIHSK